MKHAKIIGFISVKGGVGKTTAVANLGLILSKDYNKKVLIVDANLSGPNLALHFGFTKPQNTLHDVLDGKVKIQKAIYEHTSGLHLLPASLMSRKVDTKRLTNYITSLRSFYDLILIDSSPAMNKELESAIDVSDELFVLTTPDYVTLASTLHTLKAAKTRRTHVSGIIINKARGKRYELSLDDIQEATKMPVVSVLYDNSKIIEALSRNNPIAAVFPLSDAAVEYKKLAAALIGDRYTDTRLKSKIKTAFSKRLSQDEVNRAIIMVSHY